MDESTDKVYAKHKGLIKSLINSIIINNPSIVDAQDLQQAGALAFITALRSYDPSLGSFPSYIRRCIRNALLEQANSFNRVFTVDEKVRRQANEVRRLRLRGVSDEDIMNQLGIKTKTTLYSLIELVESRSVDIDQVDIPSDHSVGEDDIFRMLGEIGLTELEMQFVNLTIKDYSIDAIISVMNLSRATLYAIKASIRDKILAWGKSKE